MIWNIVAAGYLVIILIAIGVEIYSHRKPNTIAPLGDMLDHVMQSRTTRVAVIAAWWWFGIRNTGHGFASLFSVPVDKHWPEGNGVWRNGKLFAMRYQLWLIQFFYGWAIYASAKGGLEARPKISIKTRNAT